MNYLIGSTLSLFGLNLLKLSIENFVNIDTANTDASDNNTVLNIGDGGSPIENKLPYNENIRGNLNYGKYPPCYNISYESQQIYDSLEINDNIENHQRLLNIYSILLCQKYHAGYRECNPGMLRDRVKEVKRMVPKGTNLLPYLKKVNQYVKLNDSKVSELILYSFYVIEKHMEKITDDKIHALNRSFCSNHLRELLMLCNGY
jgi:hypothetical protein